MSSHEYGMGRIRAVDPNDRRYLMRSVVPSTVPIVPKFWNAPTALDQNGYPHCVGYSCKGALLSGPIVNRYGIAADEIYRRAQFVDEWEGEGYDGTSVRAGMKVLQAEGLIASYLWADGADTVRDFVIVHGPVVLGTDWDSSMFTPNRDGLIIPNGRSVGGHAYLVVGYDPGRDAFRILNSWGRGWGQNGRAWLRRGDAEDLIRHRYGEAAGPTEIKYVPLAL